MAELKTEKLASGGVTGKAPLLVAPKLTAQNALDCERRMEDLRISGRRAVLVVEDSRGLSPDYLARVGALVRVRGTVAERLVTSGGDASVRRMLYQAALLLMLLLAAAVLLNIILGGAIQDQPPLA